MNKNVLVLLVCITSLMNSFGQKVVRKSVISPEISTVFINTTDCYELILETSESNEALVEAEIEGEYKDDLFVNMVSKGDIIEIKTGFRPTFVNPNDKLSAHKVISIALKIQLPKNLNVSVFGTYTRVVPRGEYKKLTIGLYDGSCEIQDASGKVEVNTHKGDIHLFARQANIETHNSFGKIEGDIPIGSSNYFKLSTITGNIFLKNTN